jgi:hypothetical protein
MQGKALLSRGNTWGHVCTHGACTIKIVIYGFRSKLVCLSIVNMLVIDYKRHSLIMKSVYYEAVIFYSTGLRVNAMKLFLSAHHNKLECLYLTNFFSLV